MPSVPPVAAKIAGSAHRPFEIELEFEAKEKHS